MSSRLAHKDPEHELPAEKEDLQMEARTGVTHSNQAHHSYVAEHTTVGFFTDPTVCIGCKACEVACKEWNNVPADGMVWTGNSYDNTGSLGASTWRHVKFLEVGRRLGIAGAGTDDGRTGKSVRLAVSVRCL